MGSGKVVKLDSRAKGEVERPRHSLIGVLVYVIAIASLLDALVLMSVTPNEYIPRWIGYVAAPWLGVWAWRHRRLDAVAVAWVITGLLGATWPDTSSGWKWVTGSPALLAAIPFIAWLQELGHRKASKQG